MSDEETASNLGFVHVQRMDQYENEVIDAMEGSTEPYITESKEELEAKITHVEDHLKKAKINGEKKKILMYEKQLQDLRIKLVMPESIQVDLGTSKAKDDKEASLPDTNEEEMKKYWHYKVMHTSFAGDDSINLTVDDSDESIYESRNQFIQEHCEPMVEFHEVEGGLNIPIPIWKSLFLHQRVAIQWLWDLWQQKSGGIEGDEMGLGKTAIVCVFIGSLIRSKLLKKPTIVLCPLTVAQQWIRELHIWCPELKAILLHSTRTNKKISDDDLIGQIEGSTSVIVTNYETLHRLKDTMSLHIIDWGIVICDEGHKIRNHTSSISHLVKRLTSDFRLAVTGSPIQNTLIELWSLFDFAVPGLLGALDVFEHEFAEPIKQGGYANASASDVFKAYSAAIELQTMIKPYLIRRLKKDVEADLPAKSEEIFFVNLTPSQAQAYQDFLDSPLCRLILGGQGEVFVGIDHLRKICNHPALIEDSSYQPDLHYSAKLLLLEKILPQWQKHDHRCLLFSQYLKMLDLVGTLLENLGLSFFRIDGETPPMQRQTTIDKFNNGERFACILSTKVGGVGVNLIGADRVVIIDPDWNPSTDNQALERAWRIGQTKPVSVFRLITVGTIEEKMYKKQIFKQFLSNKILQNPNQKRMFMPSTVGDLFRLETDEELKDSENEDSDDSGDHNEDKELMQSLCDGGDIQRVFHHDTLFHDSSNPERIIEKNRAKKAIRAAKERIKNSVGGNRLNLFGKKSKGEVSSAVLISRIHDKSTDTEATERLTNELLNYFRVHDHSVTTKEIISRFSNNSDAQSKPMLLKQILRRIAVLNKRTHVWHLMNKFKEAEAESEDEI